MQQFALAGNLQEFSIEDILGLLDWGKTGTLAVKRRQEEIVVYLVRGAITDTEHAGVPQFTLGEILNRAGFLSAQQMGEISILRLGNQRRVGAVLVELGLISPKVLEDYLRLRIKNALRELSSWQEGTFSFQRGAPAKATGSALQVDVKEVLADIKQFRVEWAQLAGRIRDFDCVLQTWALVGERTKSADTSRLNPTTQQVLAAIDGKGSIRMIAQALFLDDLQAARAVDELLYAGLARITDEIPVATKQFTSRVEVDDETEDDLIGLLAKSQLIPAAINSDKPGDRIKALLGALQDCINDLLEYQDNQFKAGETPEAANLSEEYLEQRFADMLADLQTTYPALEALQIANRRVDTSDLVETYNLILGDTRHSFYLEAVQGLSALVKAAFDWVLGDEIDNPAIAAECQDAWHAFFEEIENKVNELALADGWGKKESSSSLFRRGRKS